MISINHRLQPFDLSSKLNTFWELSGSKIGLIDQKYDVSKGSPVFTIKGQYSTRGWTEWTQGFQFGSAILQYDATGEKEFLHSGRKKTLEVMAPHISHIGVHDHGFNNVSTYGNLLRLMRGGKTEFDEWEKNFYELALKISGAVQASRWTNTKNGGFIHSFNGPHSLFVDTIRSCRALVVSHLLGHVFQAENDVKINLLERALLHIKRQPISRYTTEKAAIPMTSGDVQPMKVYSIPMTATSAAPTPSKVIPASPPGHADWPGPCVASLKNWNVWKSYRKMNCRLLVVANK
jgi:hypothetical protein